MNLSIIIIGDEILLGGVTDTNSGLIARKFTADGWQVRRIRTVADKAADIEAAICVYRMMVLGLDHGQCW